MTSGYPERLTDPAAGADFAAAAGDQADMVAVEEAEETPQPFLDLVGGDAIFAQSGGRCSIGFTARSGPTSFVITAGHCTELGGNWLGFNQALIGPVSGTSFPAARQSAGTARRMSERRKIALGRTSAHDGGSRYAFEM